MAGLFVDRPHIYGTNLESQVYLQIKNCILWVRKQHIKWIYHMAYHPLNSGLQKLEEATEHLLPKWLEIMSRRTFTSICSHSTWRGPKAGLHKTDSSAFTSDLRKMGLGRMLVRPYNSSPHYFNMPSLLYEAIPVLGFERWMVEPGIIPKQETVIMALSFYSRICKGLDGMDYAFNPSCKIEDDSDCSCSA